MTDDSKRRAIREFFTAPRPQLHLRTLVIGGCLVFLGLLSVASGEVGSGLVATVVGVGIGLFLPVRTRAVPGEPENEAQLVSLVRYPAARRRLEDRVAPDQVSAWLMEEVERIEDRSGEVLGLDETTRDPICVVGPLYQATVQGVDPAVVLRRRVADGYLYSTYRVSVFQFTDSFLAYDQVTLNLLDGVTTDERTGELFYRNVVAVRTLTQPSRDVLKSGEALEHATIFSLTASGGDRLQVVLDDPAIRASERLRSLGEAAVANIRMMVRQYNHLVPE